MHRAYNAFPIPQDGEAPVIGAHGAGSKPSFDDMMLRVSQLRRRGLPSPSPVADKLWLYTVHDVGCHPLFPRGDGTIGSGAAQLERYWYTASERLVLCSLTEDAVHLREHSPGVWKGKWLGFGRHDVTLELHRAQTIVDALCELGCTRLVGVEIGVWRGETSQHLLRVFPGLHLHLVDAWKAYPKQAADSCLKTATQETFDAAYRSAVHATQFTADRRTIHRMDSVQAASSFEDGSLDFIFIDAEHGYESVVADINSWWPKLKPGGILFGHDYGHPRFPGVKRAFDELFPGQLTPAPDFMVYHHRRAA